MENFHYNFYVFLIYLLESKSDQVYELLRFIPNLLFIIHNFYSFTISLVQIINFLAKVNNAFHIPKTFLEDLIHIRYRLLFQVNCTLLFMIIIFHKSAVHVFKLCLIYLILIFRTLIFIELLKALNFNYKFSLLKIEVYKIKQNY